MAFITEFYRTASSLILIVFMASCQYVNKAPVPKDDWPAFGDTSLKALTAADRSQLEGIYIFKNGKDVFGPQAALKWSYHLKDKDSVWYLTGFCKEDASYFICQGKKNDRTILLDGYWRKMSDTRTGIIRFKTPLSSHTQIIGLRSHHENEPRDSLILNYDRPLYQSSDFELIAHRGGGRNNDLLPASENTVELIRLASRLGATGIEIDVKRSSDDSLVLYHDERVNDRLTTKPGIRKKLDEYTFEELRELDLKDDETIPTLREALEVVLNETPLQMVWLDTKFKGPVAGLEKIRKEFEARAKAMNRKVILYLGIPDEQVFEQFRKLPDHKQIPSICELDMGFANLINSPVWAPMWTNGRQQGETAYNKTRGRKAYVWTVDQGKQIEDIIYNAHFDGLVTNLPSLLCYYYYTQPKP